MNAIWIIATNTLRQTTRQRLYLNVAIFGVAMVLLSMVLGQITFGYPERVVRSIGLGGLTIATDLIALLVGVTLVHQEIDRKTLFVVLTRPVRRWQYVLGRFLGLQAALLLVFLGFSLVFAGTLESVGGTIRSQDAVALFMVLPEASILAAFGLLLSCFSTPTVASGMGLGFWIASATADDLTRLTSSADEVTKLVAKGLSYLLPALGRFNFRAAAVYALPVSGEELSSALAYAMAYVICLVALASAVLARREMV